MEGSSLKLIVEKGPREGETLSCRSGSVIRIGRLLRGNTFAIKDAGISSKHLLIEFKDEKWVIFDLGTSNGTFLNTVQLQEMTAFGLKDGDVIKIGEYTSLKVYIEEESKPVSLNVKIEEESKPVKGSRKVGRKPAVDVGIADEFDVENGENQLRRNPRRGATTRNARASEDKPPNPVQASLPKVQNIRGKSKLVTESRGEQENVASIAENRRRRGASRRTKSSKDEPVESVLDSVSENQNVVNCRELVSPRRTRASKDDSLMDVLKIHESSNFGLDNSRELENVDPVKEKQMRQLAPREAKAPHDKFPESLPIPVSEASLIPERSKLQQEMCNESQDIPAIDKNSVPTNAENGIDLEKMTLGEWFDYLEVYLPKQINETAEEIISGMKGRANQVKEFLSAQHDLKGKNCGLDPEGVSV